MEYNKIIAVTGLQGLFELISSKNDGAIVKSLDDKTTRFVSSRIHNFSHLETIEIYTVRDNVNLADILLAMKNSSKVLPDARNNDAVKTYFEAVYPDLDFSRVYASDMKKIVKWFEILQKNDIEIKLTEPAPAEAASPVPATVPEKEEKAESAAPIKAEKEAKEEAVPRKKAAPKKKDTEGDTTTPAEKPIKKASPKTPKAEKEAKEETASVKKASPKKK